MRSQQKMYAGQGRRDKNGRDDRHVESMMLVARNDRCILHRVHGELLNGSKSSHFEVVLRFIARL